MCPEATSWRAGSLGRYCEELAEIGVVVDPAEDDRLLRAGRPDRADERLEAGRRDTAAGRRRRSRSCSRAASRPTARPESGCGSFHSAIATSVTGSKMMPRSPLSAGGEAAPEGGHVALVGHVVDLRRLLRIGSEHLDDRHHVQAVPAQERDVGEHGLPVAGRVAADGRPLTPSQQSSFSVSRTTLIFQLRIAVTDAWSTGPSLKPDVVVGAAALERRPIDPTELHHAAAAVDELAALDPDRRRSRHRRNRAGSPRDEARGQRDHGQCRAGDPPGPRSGNNPFHAGSMMDAGRRRYRVFP